MPMTVHKNKQLPEFHCILKKIADVPGGVNLYSRPGYSHVGCIIPEGAVISIFAPGKAYINDHGQVAETAEIGAKSIKLKKGSCIGIGIYSVGTITNVAYNSDGTITCTLSEALAAAVTAGTEVMRA